MAITLSAIPLIKSISVYSSYAKPVLSASLVWRKTGDTAWQRGVTPYLDAIGGRLVSFIHSCEPDTSYDMEMSITYTDVTTDRDSIVATTQGLLPPGGTAGDIFVRKDGDDIAGDGSSLNPYLTVPKAVSVVVPGGRILVGPGNYTEFVNTYGRPGTFNAWSYLESLDPLNQAILSVEGMYHGAPYWCLKDITLQDTNGHCVYMFDGRGNGVPDFWVNGCTFRRWGRVIGAAVNPAALRFTNIGGRLRAVGNVFDMQDDNVPAGSVGAIYMWEAKQGENSVIDNTFLLRGANSKLDAVATGREGSPGEGWVRDGEFADNVVDGAPDDMVQLEGGCYNVRVWGNKGQDCFRTFGLRVIRGPAWIFRNTMLITPAQFSRYWNYNECAWLKIGDYTAGPLFLYNNTFMDTTGFASHTGIFRNKGSYPNVYARNNLVVAPGAIGYRWPDGMPQEWDFNTYSTKRLRYWAVDGLQVTHPTFDSWRDATGQETNGADVADPTTLLVDPDNGDFTPKSRSALVDRGVNIPGITNDFLGLAPDIGAVESGATANTFILTVSVQGQGTVTPSSGQYLQGTPVTLTASAAPGWRFVEWRGGVTDTLNPVTLMMDGNKSVTAVFAPIIVPPGEFALSITVLGNGQTDPAAGNYAVVQGGVVQITATPDAGMTFDRWEYNGQTSKANPLVIQINQDTSVVAVFKTGGGGNISLPSLILVGVGIAALAARAR